MVVLKGTVHKVGDDVNTDVIYPGKFLPIADLDEMGKHFMEGYGQGFPEKVQDGDIIVAGKYFGCGSSREQAAIAAKTRGVSAIVAKSFARIYYRNAINQGLLIVVCQDTDDIKDGVDIEIDTDAGTIKTSDGKTIKCDSLPPFLMEIIEDGGLIEHLKKKMKMAPE